MNRDRKKRFWDGERFRFPEYYEIETNRYFDTFRDLENNTPIKNLVVSDFTGLTDKNGKEIYEGDILKVQGTKREGVYYSEVIYDRNMFKLKDNRTYFNDHAAASMQMAIVAGNIYENPELLKP